MYLLYMGKDDADRIDGDNDEDSQGEQAKTLNFQWVTQGVASNGQYSINDMKSLLQKLENLWEQDTWMETAAKKPSWSIFDSSRKIELGLPHPLRHSTIPLTILVQ